MNKLQLIKESFVATILILLITYGLGFLSLKAEFVKGFRQELNGFDIYDLYFSGGPSSDTKMDEDIIIVEIGNNRAEIANQVKILQKYSPKVIGIDAVFADKKNPSDDLKLVQSFTPSSNIVFACTLTHNSTNNYFWRDSNFFKSKVHPYQTGYINLPGDSFSVARHFTPFYKNGDSIYPSFSSAIIQQYTPAQFQKLQSRNNELEIINYKRNLLNYNNFTKQDLIYYDSAKQLANILAGKIVLLGYFVKRGPKVLEDLHFTPMNEQISGRSFPDMYGVVIQANIISMLLKEDYMTQLPAASGYLAAGIFTFLFLLFILWRYKKSAHPKHGWFLLMQFFFIIVTIYLFLQIFAWTHIKVPLLPMMIALVLCVELFGLYKSLALWLKKKYNYVTVLEP